MRTWQVERRKRTRHLIELGGLVVKAGIVDLTGDDRAMIYGAMIWMAEKLNSEDGEHARDTMDETRKDGVRDGTSGRRHDTTNRRRIGRDRWRAARRPHISQRRPPSRGNAAQIQIFLPQLPLAKRAISP
jgi:hypothetical protein